MNVTLRFTLVALLAMSFWGLPRHSSAQCTPDQTLGSATHYPTTLATGCVGQPYSETIYISFPDDSVVSGANVVFDYFEIVGNTLPAGLSYSCNVSNCKWTPSNTPKSQELLFGCITISGTPTQPFNGQFTFDIEGCGTVIFITQCQTEVVPFNLTILPSPTADYNTQVNQNQVSFNDLSVANGDPIATWSWDFGDGATSSQQNPTHTYAAPGNYAPCLTVSTATCQSQHCSSIDIVSVSMDPWLDFSRQVRAFPNPASGSITLELGQVTRPQVALRNLEGKLIRDWHFQGADPNFQEILSLEGIPGGLYFIDIQAKEGQMTRKLRIE